MNTIKRIVAALTMFVLVNAVNAQEFSVYLAGGLSGKNQTPTQGASKLQIGGNIGIGYAHPLSKNWSMLTGLEMGFYGNKLEANKYNYKNYTVDATKSAFEYRLTADNYTGSSSFKSLNIPLMVQYKTSEGFPLYINLGAKFLLPMEERINHTATNMQLSGYYPNNNLVLDNDPINGFGERKELNTETTNKLKTVVALSTEVGTFFKVSENSKLYAGLYLDYGITNINKKTIVSDKESPIVAYNSLGLDKVKLNNSLAVSSKAAGEKILAFGVQVRYAFGRRKKAPKVVEEVPVVIEPVVEEKIVEEKPIIKEAPIKVIPAPIIKKEPVVTTLDPFVYGFGQSALNEGNKRALDKVAMLLQEDTKATVLLESHADSRGTEAYNLALTKTRVLNVYNYLINKGVDSSRISQEYYGETMLVNNCKDGVKCTEQEHSKNRRTLLKVIKSN